MKETALVLNALLMWVLGLGSVAAQSKLRNVLMYPDSYDGLCRGLPAISALAIRVQWAWWVLPLLWSVLTVLLLVTGRRKPEKLPDLLHLHTSATLLVGVFMLGFFVVAGVMPFINMIVKLK